MRVCPRCSTETTELLCPDDAAPTIEVQDSTPTTYPPGTMIAERYRIDDVIGIGGFGAVYRCMQLNMNQTVAVKVLRNEHAQSIEHVKRFTREAQAASKLKHPNTIHIFDFGQNKDGALYLAMEYVEGETLGHRLDTHTTIHWDTLIHIITQVCHSLTEAHGAGLIHRDLKPENVMLVQVAGDPNFVKVLDFGIAKLANATTQGETNLTEAGMIMGTPTYMSPEQAKGDNIDARSDIYALGVLMYEALTGRPPFLGETPMNVLVAHIKDPPPVIPRQCNIPAELEKVVLSCLAKEPAQRPQSTVQLVDWLVKAARAIREPQSTTVSRAPLEAGPTTGMSAVETSMVPAASALPGSGPVGAAPASAPAAPANRAPLYIGLGAFAAVAALAAAVALLVDKPDPPVGAVQAAIAAPVAPAAVPAAVGAVEKAKQDQDNQREAAAKISAARAAADKTAAERAAADKVVAERAAADKLVAERAAAEKLAADKVVPAKSARPESKGSAKVEKAEKVETPQVGKSPPVVKTVVPVAQKPEPEKHEDKKGKGSSPDDFRLDDDPPK